MAELSDENIDQFDCTIVVCNLNAKQGQFMLSFEEMNGIGLQIFDLCRQCLRHKRAALIIGGSAAHWGFDPRWDAMVRKCVIVARECGVPTINGVHYYESWTLQEEDFLALKTEENHAQVVGCWKRRAVCSMPSSHMAATP